MPGFWLPTKAIVTHNLFTNQANTSHSSRKEPS